MTGAQWFTLVMFVLVVLFLLWAWLMNRLDERAERRQAHKMRRGEPPALGGGARHLRTGDRRR